MQRARVVWRSRLLKGGIPMNMKPESGGAIRKGQKITQSFQKWLLVVVVIAFLFTVFALWSIQTNLSKQSAMDLLELNISDVRQDVIDASDENLLALTGEVAAVVNDAPEVDSAYLGELLNKFDVSEINVIDENGIIIATTHEDFLGYNMADGEQSAEFLRILNGLNTYVQSYQPTSHDANLSRKYAGVALNDGGFVQVGYDSERFQRDIASQVIGVTRNRHVGEGGCVIIADESGNIVSDQQENEGQPLPVTGLDLDLITHSGDDIFEATVYGEPCYCKVVKAEGYYITAVMPASETVVSRNVSIGITTAVEVIVFLALFAVIYVLVRRLVVDNIRKVNGALSQIADGDLDVVVDVRSHEEFSSLSDDINSTVDTLKRYITDAETRIDAELQFANAIQHSALPSVFPPYPHRKEFDIWATMHTAKEVGGDFYDFYFVDEEVLAFLIADVSGKGIPAAMFMMTSKTLLKSYAESHMTVEEVLTQANNKLCEGNDADMFVTVWMGYLNTRTGMVSFANAGHGHPIVKRANGECDYASFRSGLVLAGIEGIRYRRGELQLNPGDVLYLYTDGVTEATNSDNAMYSEARLLETLKNMDSDPEAICASVVDDVQVFVGDAPQFDDITMLCLKYNGGPS